MPKGRVSPVGQVLAATDGLAGVAQGSGLQARQAGIDPASLDAERDAGIGGGQRLQHVVRHQGRARWPPSRGAGAFSGGLRSPSGTFCDCPGLFEEL